MKLPPFNNRYVAALRETVLRLPEGKVLLHKSAVKSYAAMEKNPSVRRASVFVPLCNRHGVPSVLLTVRTSTVGSHKGHVSFPGGHRDGGETAQEAALRETREELFGLESTLDMALVASVIGECQTIPALTVSFLLILLLFAQVS